MSALYLYAIVGEPPRTGAGEGLCGEALVALPCAGALAVVGEMAAAPPVEERTLREHDRAVRRIAGGVAAILPARFGTVLPDQAALEALLAPRAAELAAALAQVTAREQMTLRIYGDGPAAPPAAPEAGDGAEGALGPGARYLAARLRARAAEPPGLAAVRAALADQVAAERVERHDRPPLLASAYHLIARGAADAYRDALERAAPALPVRVAASGPWPPYAFAPDGWGATP